MGIAAIAAIATVLHKYFLANFAAIFNCPREFQPFLGVICKIADFACGGEGIFSRQFVSANELILRNGRNILPLYKRIGVVGKKIADRLFGC